MRLITCIALVCKISTQGMSPNRDMMRAYTPTGRITCISFVCDFNWRYTPSHPIETWQGLTLQHAINAPIKKIVQGLRLIICNILSWSDYRNSIWPEHDCDRIVCRWWWWNSSQSGISYLSHWNNMILPPQDWTLQSLTQYCQRQNPSKIPRWNGDDIGEFYFT
jgi:hypothetical protein